MCKFQVGDKVIIRFNLDVTEFGCMTGTKYFSETHPSVYDVCTEPMFELGGQVAVIQIARNGKYRIDLDKGEYVWTDGMFENERVV